jgi:hypothetical protein
LKVALRFANSTLGRLFAATGIYIIFSVVLVEIFYVMTTLLSPSDREFRFLPLDLVFYFHRYGYDTGYATAPELFEWVTWFFWIVYWIVVIYGRIYSIQSSKNLWFLNWVFVFATTSVLSLFNSILLGNNGPTYYNLYFSGIIYFNLLYMVLAQFVPLKFLRLKSIT